MKSPEETDHPRIFVKLNLGGRFGPLQVVPVKPWPNPKLSARLDAWNLGTVDALSYVEASGWAGGANASGQVAVGVVAGGSASHSTSDSWLSLALDDIDGDGAVDHVLRTKGMAEVRARLNKGGKANLLRRVVRPLGGSFTLDYRREGNRVDADGARAVDMPANQWALASVTVDDGQGSQPLKTELEYGAAAGHGAFYDRTRRESYGFSHVLTRRSDGSTVEAVFRNQRPYDRGLLEESTEKDEAGFLVRKVVNTYEDRPVGPDSIFVALRERTTTFFEGDRGPLAASAPSHKERWDYDGSGNVTLYADEGERGDPSDDLTHVIKYEQQELVASGHLHRPTFIESTGNGEVLRRRTAHYRADGSPDLVTDLLAKGKQPATGAAYTGVDATNPKWTFAYDAFGNVTSVTDPKGYELTYGYDPQTQTFRTSVTESSPGFGYVSRVDHDPRFGLPSVITDVNGHKQRIEYDDFGRPREVWGPSDVQGVAGAPTVAFEYQPARLLPEKTADGRDLYSPALAVTHHKDVARDPFADDRQKWDPIDTVTFVDGLGRLIQTKKDHELDQGAGRPPLVGTTVSGRVTFDHRGRVHTQAQPFFSAEPPTTYLRVGAAEARHATTFKYDSLSRVRQVLTPDGGVTQTSYQLGLFDGRTRLLTLVQDPVQARDAQATTNVAQHRQRATFRTVRDEIVAVQEKNRIRGTLTTLTTRYAYNPVSELERVTDAKGNVTRSEYDTLGHMIALASPDMGRTEWRYDLAGNVAAKETENLRNRASSSATSTTSTDSRRSTTRTART
jgi:YD repeat-containing protein